MELQLCYIIPGKPPPEPKSAIPEQFFSSINLTNCALSRICLTHICFSVLLAIKLRFLLYISSFFTKLSSFFIFRASNFKSCSIEMKKFDFILFRAKNDSVTINFLG